MFTQDEIDAAVQRYLSSEVAVTRTKTGSRDTTAIKKQVYDLLATGLLLRPSAIYYIIWLSGNRLRSAATQQLLRLRSIQTSGPNVSRASKRVESTTELVNAQAALIELSASFSSRFTGVAGAVGPAVQRFKSSVTNFATSELSKNVVVGGDVIETAEELRELIKTTWVDGSAAHTEILTRVNALQEVLDDYRAVRLPESTFQSIVLRCQEKTLELQESMAAATAPRDSREALLDILAMRTLIQRASSFRAPSTILSPLVQDASTGTFVDGPGTEASILGGTGAFNYAAGSVLDIDVNQAAQTVSTVLPGTSSAVLRSKTLSPWVAPPSTNPATFTVDFTHTDTVAMNMGWASGPIAASAMSAAYPHITVTWDAGTSQLVFTSDQTSDLSRLRVTGHSDFLSWAFAPGAITDVYGTAVDASAVVTAIQQSSSAVRATIERTDYFAGTVPLSNNVLTVKTHEGTDLDADGTTTVTTGVNLEALGVVPGDIVKITLPAVERTVVSVSGGSMVLDDVVSAVTGATYFVAPDLSAVLLGSRVKVTSNSIAENTRYSRVIGINPGEVELQSTFAADTVHVSIFLDRLRVAAIGTSVNSDIDAQISTGDTALGLSGLSAVVSLSKFSVPGSDFGARGVEVGDTIDLVSPSLDTFQCTITEVGTSYLLLDPSVPYEAGQWSFRISGTAALRFDTLLTALAAFETALPTASQLDTVMRRLISGARYSEELEDTLGAYVEALEDLLEALTEYVTPRESTVDKSLGLLREHGMDRAFDLFLDLSLSEFFTMKDDEVSYKTWLIRKSADVTRQVVPVTKDPRDVNSQWRTVSTQQTTYDPLGGSDKESNG